MENINKIIGKNLLQLRKYKKLTQLELAEKLNYSDKTISKWETGESLPSVEILYNLSSFYEITLDDLVNEDFTPGEKEKTKKTLRDKLFSTHLMITLLAVSVVWLIATILFVTIKLAWSINYPLVFMWALPISCILLIIFNSIWGKIYLLFPILTIMLWSTLACIQIQLLFLENIWIIYILGIPLQVAIILWNVMINKPRKPKKKEKTNGQELAKKEIKNTNDTSKASDDILQNSKNNFSEDKKDENDTRKHNDDLSDLSTKLY